MRDRFSLNRKQLLADYSEISENRPEAAAATALRMKSVQFRDVLATQITDGEMDFVQLREQLLCDPDDIKRKHSERIFVLAELGRVCLLQNCDSDDVYFGEKAIELACELFPSDNSTRKFRRVLVQHYINTGQDKKAEFHLSRHKDIDREFHQYLRAEMRNPFTNRENPDHDSWLRNFNARLRKDGLATVTVDTTAASPFDGLSCEVEKTGELFDPEKPQVAVVITTFRPSRAGLFLSVNSILNQSLRNVEVIIVDDSSPEEFQPILREVAALDERIRVLSTPRNSGTYVARNIGYAAAKAELIAGQDDDDWSHPQRLEIQLAALESNPEWAGCTVRSVTCTPQLNRVVPGYSPLRYNSSSLMLRRTDFEKLGGFLPIRKAADTELRMRLERITGRIVHEIVQPLTFVRLSTGSLSRKEFSVGWQHPARQRFRSAYRHWHATASVTELQLDLAAPLPIAVPRRFLINPESFVTHLDVVFAGDWRAHGGVQESMISEIQALTKANLNVGVLHLESANLMTRTMDPLCPQVQELINSGAVHEVLYDDPVSIDLLVLRYPPILQFVGEEPTTLSVKRLIIVADYAPSDSNGHSIKYLVDDVQRNAENTLCQNVTWVPEGPHIRSALRPYLSDDKLADFDLPGVIDSAKWRSYRTGQRGIVPVIGKHSTDSMVSWPDDEENLSLYYPTDGSVDVRILGGTRTVQRIHKNAVSPVGWTVYKQEEIPAQTFLRMLDFFVYYQDPNVVPRFARSILEAMASSVVVVLPPQYEEIFGEAAVYAEPHEVQDIVQSFHCDWSMYLAQMEKAQHTLKTCFNQETYVDRILTLLRDTDHNQGALSEQN